VKPHCFAGWDFDGLSALWIPPIERRLAIFSTGVASLAGVPVYIMLAKKFDTRWLMMFGLALFGLSMWAFSYITSDWSGGELLVPQILRGFPQVFAVAPAVTLGLGSLPQERLKYASGLFNMMCGAIVNVQTNFHFNMISSHLRACRSDRGLKGTAAPGRLI